MAKKKRTRKGAKNAAKRAPKKRDALEKELKAFHQKPKHQRQKEGEDFDFTQLTGQIKQKLKDAPPALERLPEASLRRGTGDEAFVMERIPSGITGLDELIQGGFEKGSTILVVGAAGTGKSLFGLQFLHHGATEKNEPGIYISFEETRASLYRHSASFGWNFEELEKKKRFKVIEYKPHEVERLMKEGGGPIRDEIKELGAKRLVIDSITSYGLLFKDEYKKRATILELFELLRKWGCTTLVISELPPKAAEVKEGGVGFLTDAILSLTYARGEDKDVRVHTCEILKMRGTKHADKLLAIGFENHGLVIYPNVEVF